MTTKGLLVVTAFAEGGTGLLLLFMPALTTKLLLGTALTSPEAMLVGRVGGAALLSICLNCWLERNRNGAHPAIGLIAGLTFYNAAVVVLLVYAAVIADLHGLGIWPACCLHLALLAWCAACLRERPRLKPPRVSERSS